MKKIFALLLAGLFAASLQAQQSTYRPTQEQKLNEEYCTGLFKTTEGTIINIMDQPSVAAYFNILEWLHGRVAGLRTYTSRTGVVIPIMRNRIPGIYLDEFQVSASDLSNLSIHDIAMVKVIRQPFPGGFHGEGGAIAIYTRKGEEDGHAGP